MVELFLNAIPNVLSAMFVGSTAGGLVQVCEEDFPQLSKFKDKMIIVMNENEIDSGIQKAFWKSYDDTYNGVKLPAVCEEALKAVGSSKEELGNALNWRVNTKTEGVL
jgi:hypothetical protein